MLASIESALAALLLSNLGIFAKSIALLLVVISTFGKLNPAEQFGPVKTVSPKIHVLPNSPPGVSFLANSELAF
jgi:hypothetical protein